MMNGVGWMTAPFFSFNSFVLFQVLKHYLLKNKKNHPQANTLAICE